MPLGGLEFIERRPARLGTRPEVREIFAAKRASSFFGKTKGGIKL